MTRAERLAEQEARAQTSLVKRRKALTKVRAKIRAEEQKVVTQRHIAVGKMVDDAGLLVLNDTDLAGIFAVLKPLCEVPNPVAVLEALLRDAGNLPAVPVDGCADLRSCGPCGASGDTVQ
jgi:hypothetical protein